MTTAATVIGHFPLVLAKGPGAGARNSIGIMLVSGMIIGTLFTLFVVPSIYMLVARTHQADEADAELESILPEATDNELPRYVAG
jgi:multidrug efflux pump